MMNRCQEECFTLRLALAAIALSLCSQIPVTAQDIDAYYVRRLWTADKPPVDNGVLLVQDGKVLAAGPVDDVQVPANAVEHDLRERVIIPGLVIAETSLAESGRDDERAITPEVRAADGFDFFADYTGAIRGGVTTVQIAPGSRRLMPGQGSVIKLAGEDIDKRTIRDQESLRIILSSASRNPPNIYEPPVGAVSVEKPLEPTKPQLARSLASAVAGVRALFDAAKDSGGEPLAASEALILDEVATYIGNGRAVRITAQQAAEVRAALRLAGDYGIQLVLVDPREVKLLTESKEITADRVRGIVVTANLRPGQITNTPIPSDDNPRAARAWEIAGDLAEAGWANKLALKASTDGDLADILFLAGLMKRGRLTDEQVLAMLTINSARMMGVDDRVGSLGPGKDADFVVLTEDPFSRRSHVVATYINGTDASTIAPTDKASPTTPPTVLLARQVFTGDGQVIQGGSVVVSGNKIRSVGADVSAPVDAARRRFSEGVIVPGFIDLTTGLGLGGPLSGSTPVQTKLGERLFADDPAVREARRGGVTTVLLGPTSSAPGPLVAFKLGGDLRVVKDPVALRFRVSGNLTTTVASLKRTLTSAKTYDETWKKYEKDLAAYKVKLKEYEAAKAKYDAAQKAKAAKQKAEEEKKKKEAEQKKDADKDKPSGDSEKKTEDSSGEEKKDAPPADKKEPPKPDTKKEGDAGKKEGEQQDAKKTTSEQDKPPKKPTEPKKPRQSATSDAYRPLLAGKIPAMVEARSAKAMEAALKLFRDEFKLRTILTGADAAHRLPQQLADKQAAVAVGPTLVRRLEGKIINLPQVLANHSIPFGFLSQGTTGAGQLPLAVQYSVYQGLGSDDALAGLSRSPAKFLSLEDSIGTLAAGKDADLVVLSAPPFDPAAEVIAVMIDGAWVYDQEADE